MHRWLLYAALLLCSACVSGGGGQDSPKVRDGEIDVSGWDFENDGALKLDGEWLFAWQSFVDTPLSITAAKDELSARFEVPGYWKGQRIAGLPR